jgi:hypothetical protein
MKDVQIILPPGVQREQLFNNNTVNQNEQSLAVKSFRRRI